MPRKRMIDPNFWRDEKIAQCTYMERLLFQGLWTFAEDSGVGRANPMLIKADVFPYDTLRESDIQKSLAKLASLRLIKLYEIDNQSYYYVTNFKKHQTINRPSEPTLPLPPLTDGSLNTHGVFTHEINISEVKLNEEKIEEVATTRTFKKPTLDEVKAYCVERNNKVDPERFINHYQTVGWLVGKNRTPMKDWKAAVRTWEQPKPAVQEEPSVKKMPTLKELDNAKLGSRESHIVEPFKR